MSSDSNRSRKPIWGDTIRVLFLITRREFLTRARSRFFLIGTAVLVALVAGYVLIQGLVLNRTTTTLKVGFSGTAAVLAPQLDAAAPAAGLHIATKRIPDVSTGESDVRAGTLDALVSGVATSPRVAVKDKIDSGLATVLTGLVRLQVLNAALSARGIQPEAIDGQVVQAGIHVVTLTPAAAERAQRTVIGTITAILLYVSILLYGQIVSQGVVEEKANRIVEILLTTIRPSQLLFGKVIGIGLMGLLQLLIVGVVALLVGSRTHAVTVPNAALSAVLAGLAWFVLGFLLYALVYAAAGALVSRQEDLPAVTAPITVLIVGSYLSFFWVLANPTNPGAIGLSLLPPFAPILMPARMATGDASTWQVLSAIVLAILAIAGMNALAARIYTNSVIRIGARVKLREALRAA